MPRVKTFTAGGSGLPADFNSIQDDYEAAFATYKTLLARGDLDFGGGVPAGTYVLDADASGNVSFQPPGSAYASAAFYFAPADYASSSRLTKLRVRAELITNATAPVINLVYGLYPVATWGGTTGNPPTIATLGAVVAGSTVSFIAPGASSANQGNSGDFSAPTAGWYVLGVALSGGSGITVAGSRQSCRAALQMRQV